MLQTCAITGHRPTRFKWKYDENNNGCKRLKKRMRDQFVLLYEQGVRQFWVGGALGVDMWAGEILLRLKEQPEYSEIKLMVALPFEGHDAGWDERSKKRAGLSDPAQRKDRCGRRKGAGLGSQLPPAE